MEEEIVTMAFKENAREAKNEGIRSCIADMAKALLKEREFVEKLQYVRTKAEGANIYYVFVQRLDSKEEHRIQVGPVLQDYCKDDKLRPILEEHLRSYFIRLLS